VYIFYCIIVEMSNSPKNVLVTPLWESPGMGKSKGFPSWRVNLIVPQENGALYEQNPTSNNPKVRRRIEKVNRTTKNQHLLNAAENAKRASKQIPLVEPEVQPSTTLALPQPGYSQNQAPQFVNTSQQRSTTGREGFFASTEPKQTKGGSFRKMHNSRRNSRNRRTRRYGGKTETFYRISEGPNQKFSAEKINESQAGKAVAAANASAASAASSALSASSSASSAPTSVSAANAASAARVNASNAASAALAASSASGAPAATAAANATAQAAAQAALNAEEAARAAAASRGYEPPVIPGIAPIPAHASSSLDAVITTPEQIARLRQEVQNIQEAVRVEQNSYNKNTSAGKGLKQISLNREKAKLAAAQARLQAAEARMPGVRANHNLMNNTLAKRGGYHKKRNGCSRRNRRNNRNNRTRRTRR